jgi:hypothetical protein
MGAGMSQLYGRLHKTSEASGEPKVRATPEVFVTNSGRIKHFLHAAKVKNEHSDCQVVCNNRQRSFNPVWYLAYFCAENVELVLLHGQIGD